MKLLLANTNPIERKRLAAALGPAGYQLTEAASASIANKLVEDQPFDGALVEWPLASSIVPRLRSRGRAYIVLTAAAWTPPDIASAYALGADDLLKTPAPREEIVGRTDGVKRVHARLTEMQAQTSDFSTAFEVMQARTWRLMDEIIAGELGEQLGVALAPVIAPPDAAYATARASEISLVLPAESLEIRIAVGADAAACDAIAQLVLGGDTRAESLGDALRELANTAGGVLRRTGEAEGLSFTIGLPCDGDLLAGTTAQKRRWLAQAPSGLTLAFAASIASIAPRAIPAGALCEGMIIARDVTSPAGLLIASAGTYLTRSAAERLARLAGQQTLVEVTEMALPPPICAAAAGA